MKYKNYLLATLLTTSWVTTSMASVIPLKFEFSQGGFHEYTVVRDDGTPARGVNFEQLPDPTGGLRNIGTNNGATLVKGNLIPGASITGHFIGKDLNKDGRIYAGSRLAEMFNNTVPFGNELIYAEVTFNGFGTSQGPQTVVYDKNGTDAFGNPTDMENFLSAFMGVAYNLDGGALGDDANEGLSLGLFAPSTNYLFGGAFSEFSEETFGLDAVGACDGVRNCGNVYEFSGQGRFEDLFLEGAFFSSEAFQMTQVPVPVPTMFGLFAGFLGGLLMLRQSRQSS